MKRSVLVARYLQKGSAFLGAGEFAEVAQLAVHLFRTQEVAGSIPALGSVFEQATTDTYRLHIPSPSAVNERSMLSVSWKKHNGGRAD